MMKPAFYRFEVKTISRGQGKMGRRSIIACAAYRSGGKLNDSQLGRVFDYTSRSRDIAFTEMLAPDGAPDWMQDAQRAFDAIEEASKRKDARLGREFITSLPVQLNEQQQIDLAVKFAQDELVSRGMLAQVSVHRSDTNPHALILCGTRETEKSGFGKVRRDWNEVELLETLREAWADHVNAALDEAGLEERANHRSLAEQGIERIPQPKIGVAATSMVRRGFVADTFRHQAVRMVQLKNEILASLRTLLQADETPEAFGEERTPRRWWETAETVIEKTAQQAVQLVRTSWADYIQRRREQEQSGLKLT